MGHVLMNEYLWVIMLIMNFSMIMIAYIFGGRTGLYCWIPVSVIIANVQVLKTVEIFGFVSTLGNILYAGSFLATDILSENYGKKSAGKGVFIGFFSMICMTLLMQVAIMFTPHESDFAQDSLNTIFGVMPRIAAASLIAYLVSQFHDVWVYDKWKSVFPEKRFLWFRNNASTMISQLLDSSIFTLGAFWGVFEKGLLFEIFLTTYFFKLIVASADTPFLYLAEWLKGKGKIKEI